jgi:hypothetical protein
MNLVMSEAVALFQQTGLVFYHLSQIKAGQQSVTQYMTIIIVNFVTPKAGAKKRLLFNGPVTVLTGCFC